MNETIKVIIRMEHRDWVVRVDGQVVGIFHRHCHCEALGYARRILDGTVTGYPLLETEGRS